MREDARKTEGWPGSWSRSRSRSGSRPRQRTRPGPAAGGAAGPGRSRFGAVRAVVVIDEQGKVVYTQQVSEVTDEPDYDAALAALV